jgi:Magnesium transporter NIPA
MGIISVFTNCLLANVYLDEVITLNQKYGYMLILVGVTGILLIAPKESIPVSTMSSLYEIIYRPDFELLAAAMLIMLAFFIYATLTSKRQRMILYVAICSLCGSITVSCGKLLSILTRISLSASTTSLDVRSVKNSTMAVNKPLPQPSAPTYFPIVVTTTLVISIALQEFFKQHAYSRFKVSQFNPVLYAGFNAW